MAKRKGLVEVVSLPVFIQTIQYRPLHFEYHGIPDPLRCGLCLSSPMCRMNSGEILFVEYDDKDKMTRMEGTNE